MTGHLLLPALLLVWLPDHAPRAHAIDAPPVTVVRDARHLVLDNGTVVIEFARARAALVSIRYRHDGETAQIHWRDADQPERQ